MFYTETVEKIKTHISCSITFSRKSHCLWDSVEKRSEDRMATKDVTIWRIRVACWISKGICTYTHAHAHAPGYPHARTHAHTDQYVILIVFPQQQWFRERASVSRYTYKYIASLVHSAHIHSSRRCHTPNLKAPCALRFSYAYPIIKLHICWSEALSLQWRRSESQVPYSFQLMKFGVWRLALLALIAGTWRLTRYAFNMTDFHNCFRLCSVTEQNTRSISTSC